MKKLHSAFAASLIAGAVASAQDAAPYELDLTTTTTSTVYGDYWAPYRLARYEIFDI